MTKRLLNLKRAPKDHRDLRFAAIAESHLTEPPKVDLRKMSLPVFDQGEIGSCTGNAWAALRDHLRKKAVNGKGRFSPSSRLFIYNLEREANGTFSEDSGADMRDGGDVLHDFGIVLEREFPYNEANLYVKPAASLLFKAGKYKSSTYYAVDTFKDMRTCLISQYPFVFGFEVPSAFMEDTMTRTGSMPDSDWDFTKTEGGHAVMCVGYDDEKKAFLVRNSWGADWGEKGYFWMPYSYMAKDESAFNHYTLRL